MKWSRWRGRRGSQGGWALMETMLALVIVGMVAAGSAQLLMDQADQAQAKAVASDFSAFQSAAGDLFIWKRQEFIAAMKDGTGADSLCRVNVNADGSGGVSALSLNLHRCAFDTSLMRTMNMLPSSVPLDNTYGERWVAILKLQYDNASPPASTGNVEMVVVSARVDGVAPAAPADGRVFGRALTAAGFAAGQGGVVPDADRSTCVASRQGGKYEACGAGFRVDLQQFLEPAEVAAFASRLSN